MKSFGLAINDSEESLFDRIKHFDRDGKEFWSARELMPHLGYSKWQRFENAILKSQFSCQNSGSSIDEHFIYLPPSVSIGKSGVKGADFNLSRYASYLIAMNGDPRKPEIAAAQTYFAVRTRQAETRERLEQQVLSKASVKEIAEAAKLYKEFYGDSYAYRYLHQQMQKHQPHLLGEEPAISERPSLVSSTSWLTPTKIAAELKLLHRSGSPSGKAVNLLLEQLGYQRKIQNDWNPTEKAISAKLCDRKPVDTASRTQKDQLLWSSAILPILSEFALVEKLG